jgi:glycosyltransferase involved in cell wall biosynthesis
MKIDCHVHSKYSKRPSEWILKKIGCPESFTEPLGLYDIARRRGMTHVTITDHNSIGGALEIAHLPNTFISEEVTTYFPEDGCKLHVLALNITEIQHEEIQKIRENIFDLVTYFRLEKIFPIVAHPLYACNERLTADHVEKLLLMFRNFELNGARNTRENQVIRTIIENLTAEDMDRLANRHDIAPYGDIPHQKKLFGGSDDHSSLNIARTFTEFTDGIDESMPFSETCDPKATVYATAPTPLTMGHNLYSIAWQFFRNKFNLGRYATKDQLVSFLDRSLTLDTREPGMLSKVYFFLNAKKRKRVDLPLSESLATLLRTETQALIEENPDLFCSGKRHILHAGEGEERWFEFVNTLSNRVMVHFGNHLLGNLSGANVFNIFHTLGSAGGLTTLLAPYFVAFSEFTKGRDLGRRLAKRFGHTDIDDAEFREVRLAHFTDTFYEMNGVALTLRQQARAAVNNNYKYTVITCNDENHPREKGVKHFQPIGTYLLPEYEQQKVFYPPLLEMLDYCHRERINHIHTATPGPVGLAALAISKFLQVPVSGTYHTSIPQYVQVLTGSDFMEELAWKFVLWYYDQLDLIYAPSNSTRDELIAKGIKPDKIQIYPRGIDIDRFTPANRNGFYKKWSVNDNRIKLIYVGRVSKEKNLHLLLEAYRQLAEKRQDVLLTVVGDGPYLEEMKSRAGDLPCLFTGSLRGNDLTEAYASSDLFVFPSATDTFGNVVLEAQASGLPVIVTDQGGPCENIIDGETGVIIRADCPNALLSAMASLVADPRRLSAMGKAARQAMENRSFDAAFSQTWEMFGQVNGSKLSMAV